MAVLLATALFLSAAYAGNDVIDGFLAEYAKEIRIANERFVAATNRIAVQYPVDLDKMHRKYQSEGLLDELLAVKKEKERFSAVFSGELDPFEAIPEMTEDVLVDFPEPLSELQRNYRSQRESVDEARRQDVDQSSGKLLERIEQHQRNLTKRGKIDEAIEVRGAAEKIKAGIEDGSLASKILLARAQSPREEEAPAKSDEEQVQGEKPPRRSFGPWRKWTFVGDKPFSPDMSAIFHPDIRTSVSSRILEKAGNATFHADKGLAPQTVGGRLCYFSGRAAVWRLESPENLSADMLVTSRKPAPSRDKGPKFHVYVIQDRKIVQSIDVPLMSQETAVRIVKDSTSENHFALFWPRGGISKIFDLGKSSPVTVIMGVSLGSAREACDVTVQLE